MKYYYDRPMIDECEDFINVCYRPRGEENWDTRHLSVWMDRFTFISELAKWQVDNRELTDEEIIGAILAWDLTHVEEESMLKMNVMMLEAEKAHYRAFKEDSEPVNGGQNEVL